MFLFLGVVFGLASFVAWVLILIAAFSDETWKGIVGLLCGIYLLYYGLLEFDHPQKWPIFLTWIVGSVVAKVCYAFSGYGGSHSMFF